MLMYDNVCLGLGIRDRFKLAISVCVCVCVCISLEGSDTGNQYKSYSLSNADPGGIGLY